MSARLETCGKRLEIPQTEKADLTSALMLIAWVKMGQLQGGLPSLIMRNAQPMMYNLINISTAQGGGGSFQR